MVNQITLAPMEGVLDHRLRHLLCAIGGIDQCVTEFIRVTDKTYPKRVYEKIYPEMHQDSKTANNTPVKPQLLGDNPKAMAANATKLIQLGAKSIDINFGCPAKTVNSSGGGSVLLQYPNKLYAIVSAIRDALPQDIPVSAKIRLGFTDDALFLENVKAIEAAGASELTIHARTKVQGYKPPAHYHKIAEIKDELQIKIIANGEMWSVQDIEKCIRTTGVNDIMLGRGALACPELALRAKGFLTNPMTWGHICLLLLYYAKILEADCPEKYQHALLKQWLIYLRYQYGEAHLFFEKVKKLSSANAIQMALIDSIKEKKQLIENHLYIGQLDLSTFYSEIISSPAHRICRL
ncbi:MAG: tRNA-dihydrouridine synthase [Cellvibrionales bacterium]|nr:tRNA-dihydrouridine synthase [Cellvibrionales bacterium]